MKTEELSIEKIVSMVMAFRDETQTSLSEELGIAQSSLNRYIKGSPAKTKPSFENYRRLETYMKFGLVDICETMFGSINKTQEKHSEKIVEDVMQKIFEAEEA